MIHRFATYPQREINVQIHARGDAIRAAARAGEVIPWGPLSKHPSWLAVLQEGLEHVPYLVEATETGRTVGLLPLCFLSSFLFGRFLVSLPYLNVGGVLASDDGVARRLIDRAIGLADELRVRYLEFRHERVVDHPMLNAKVSHKVHMRLTLPESPESLWESFPGKVRNQVRKGQKQGLEVVWGQRELLPEFYAVFSENMRDLGTPVYPLRLFARTLRVFPHRSELCVVRRHGSPIAAALLLHGDGITEVPSASSLREFNATSANMLMYWHLLERAIGRSQRTFDFGRSTPEGGTFRFKAQWGAKPEPGVWQYYVRHGTIGDMRPDNPKYKRIIRLWQCLPLKLSQVLGPRIVRGIP